MKHALLTFFILLAACSPVTSVPAPTATDLLTSTPQPNVTPAPTGTRTPMPYQSESAAGLLIVTREGVPLTEPLGFMTLNAVVLDASQIGGGEPFTPHNEINISPCGIGVWANLGNDKLTAIYKCDDGWVTVTRNEQEIYKISIGDTSPIGGLQGFWIYDNHWVLETAFVKAPHYDEATGQITMDGELLNEKYGYEDAFGFQTINDRPFYFFKKDGKIDAWYDGQLIPLGYDTIAHYQCCSAGELNPRMWKNVVTFFSAIGRKRFLVKIGLPGTFNP